MKNKGSAVAWVIVVITIVIIACGVYYFENKGLRTYTDASGVSLQYPPTWTVLYATNGSSPEAGLTKMVGDNKLQLWFGGKEPSDGPCYPSEFVSSKEFILDGQSAYFIIMKDDNGDESAFLSSQSTTTLPCYEYNSVVVEKLLPGLPWGMQAGIDLLSSTSTTNTISDSDINEAENILNSFSIEVPVYENGVIKLEPINK